MKRDLVVLIPFIVHEDQFGLKFQVSKKISTILTHTNNGQVIVIKAVLYHGMIDHFYRAYFRSPAKFISY